MSEFMPSFACSCSIAFTMLVQCGCCCCCCRCCCCGLCAAGFHWCSLGLLLSDGMRCIWSFVFTIRALILKSRLRVDLSNLHLYANQSAFDCGVFSFVFGVTPSLRWKFRLPFFCKFRLVFFCEFHVMALVASPLLCFLIFASFVCYVFASFSSGHVIESAVWGYDSFPFRF